MLVRRISAVIFVSTASLLAACGASDPAPPTTTGGGGGGANGNYSCCLNGQAFTCPSDSTARKCAGIDDGEPDPSACTKSTLACGGGGGGGADSGGGGGGGGGAVGAECKNDDGCASKICIWKTGATFGYCSTVCESFADCPSFWDCNAVSGGSSKYCVQR